jgi:hypothetical protein
LHRDVRRTTVAAAVGSILLSLALGACGSQDSGTPIGSTASTGHRTPTKALLFDFEQPVSTLSAGARIPSGVPNGPRGEVAMAGKDVQPLRMVKGPDHQGHALAFPAPCPVAQQKTCRKAIVEVYPDTSLAPGRDDFAWGASVQLKQADTAKGSNIIQKGFSLGGGSQWKLQVDGAQGHPSCVLVGLNDKEIHEVLADVSVADNAWHDVRCSRTRDSLVITVDDAAKKSVLIPKDLTIAPPGPVRIGGKDLKPDNDQFFGSVDNLYVEVLQ